MFFFTAGCSDTSVDHNAHDRYLVRNEISLGQTAHWIFQEKGIWNGLL